MINAVQDSAEKEINNSLRILVVGKNSTIVKAIASDIATFHFISHKDLEAVEIGSFDKVFIFSWSRISLDDNLALLNQFDPKRIVFISSIAVLACARRPQWASYPNWKLICENHVLGAGGKVIRIGIWDSGHIKALPGYVPVTTARELIKAMYICLSTNAPVIWPISIRSGRLTGIKRYIGALLNYVSVVLPSRKIIQAPIAIVLKLIGSKDYGYTHDCLQFFSQRVLVGFGAVGSAVSHELGKRNFNHSIVVSQDKDLFLNSEGFRGLRIGQFKEGLSRLWHGVCITKKDNDTYHKNVPILVPRPGVPKRAVFGRVTQVDFEMPIPSVLIDHPKVKEVRVFAKAIHLAAGVINNVKILQATHPISAFFSDHEIGEIGYVQTHELVEKGLINRRFGIVSGRKVLVGRYNEFEYILDFRPKSANVMEFDAKNIYNNRTDQIVRKLFKAMSFRLINQAVFNKFGVAANADLFSVVIQIAVPDCIHLSVAGELIRCRLPESILSRLVDEVAGRFETFNKETNPRTFDAIHVHGGFDIANFPDINQRLADKKLFIHGNVLDGRPLGPFHNTISMIEREREVIANA
jgi:hypothetical protein